MARDYCHRGPVRYHRGPVGAAADTAGAAVGTVAGVVGAAIGTASAIATAPTGGPAYGPGRYAYDYWSNPNNGFVCRPGTWFKGPRQAASLL